MLKFGLIQKSDEISPLVFVVPFGRNAYSYSCDRITMSVVVFSWLQGAFLQSIFIEHLSELPFCDLTGSFALSYPCENPAIHKVFRNFRNSI